MRIALLMLSGEPEQSRKRLAQRYPGAAIAFDIELIFALRLS